MNRRGADGTLGDALRHWRDRLDPAAVGVTRERFRRVAGLRREELALTAGLSVDYVVRLEQGRASSPSPQVLAALARALRLNEAEQRHLFLLAGRAPRSEERFSARIPASVRRLLDRLEGTPVSVYDAAWSLVSWNPLYAALMGDPAASSGPELNVLWRHFTGSAGRISHTPEQRELFETAAVADLRAATERYASDARIWRLVAGLRARSERFAALWDAHAVGVHTTARKTVHHPLAGALTLDCDVVTPPGTDLRVVLYTAPEGTDAEEKLRRLAGSGGRGTVAGAGPGGSTGTGAEAQER